MPKTLSRISRINQRRRENYRKMREAEGQPYTPRLEARKPIVEVDVPEHRDVEEKGSSERKLPTKSIAALEKALRGDL